MKYLAEKKKAKEGKYNLLVLETCLIKNDGSARIIILEAIATNHIYKELVPRGSWMPE